MPGEIPNEDLTQPTVVEPDDTIDDDTDYGEPVSLSGTPEPEPAPEPEPEPEPVDPFADYGGADQALAKLKAYEQQVQQLQAPNQPQPTAQQAPEDDYQKQVATWKQGLSQSVKEAVMRKLNFAEGSDLLGDAMAEAMSPIQDTILQGMARVAGDFEAYKRQQQAEQEITQIQQAIATDPQFKDLADYSEEIGLFMKDGYPLKTAVQIARRFAAKAKPAKSAPRAPNVHDIKPRPPTVTPDGDSTSRAPTKQDRLKQADAFGKRLARGD